MKNTWTMLNLAAATWGLGILIAVTSQTYHIALWSFRISNLIAIFIPISFFHFTLFFLNQFKKNKRILISYYLLSLTYFLFSTFLPSLFIPNIEPKNSFEFYINPGKLYYLFPILFFSIAFHGHWLMWKTWKNASQNNKSIIKYVAIGTLFGFTGGGTTFFLVFDINLYPFGVYFVPIYVFAMTYVIARHQLMDIRIVIKKSLVYTILVTFITILFFLVILLTERLFQNIFGYTSLLGSLVAAAVLALAFIPLKNRIQTFVDKYFFRGTYPEIAEQNDQLRETLSRQEKFKAVATLASGIAHEIKNPVTVLQTFLEHLPRKKDDPAFIEKFSRISAQELDRMEDLIRQLLDFAKPSPLELEETDLNDLLKDTLALIAGEAGKHHIETRTSWTSASIQLRADQRQLKQAFLNILLNAIEAMPQGGILSVETSRSSGHTPRISIRDTGSGIATEDLTHIFEPFFSRKTAGTGLGLAITKDIIEKHGGEIRVSSSVGSGTTFVVEFKKANA